ncbi:hypothetical protein GALMADRAFT_784818 [Galerina marginata CBS 339.88]|uniref:Uncharacterized protein n=1 Tax=Galerina marginata (strain CBS 339.88) TaxID=685588 RepID=A0A067SW57_GALM3|nr:hypothetical protein GALMADRAFT_784818 [Galerina marginata CBS 339.88]
MNILLPFFPISSSLSFSFLYLITASVKFESPSPTVTDTSILPVILLAQELWGFRVLVASTIFLPRCYGSFLDPRRCHRTLTLLTATPHHGPLLPSPFCLRAQASSCRAAVTQAILDHCVVAHPERTQQEMSLLCVRHLDNDAKVVLSQRRFKKW